MSRVRRRSASHGDPTALSKKLTSIRLDPEIQRDLVRFAEASGRSLSNLIRHILKEWVGFQKKQARKK